MEMFKVICFWLHAILVLLYGCWFVETKPEGHTRSNLTSKSFRHEAGPQYQEPATTVVYTLSGNDNNAPCVFPFIYLKKRYTECTYKDCKHNKPWCATTGNYDNDKKWGHCQTDNDVMDCMDTHKRCGNWARDGECVVNAPYMRSKCPRSCGFCTHGGSGQGRVCKFPFFYKDTFVYDCLNFNKKMWCATTTNYNKDKRWGYCLPKLYKDIKEVNKRFLRWGECDDQHEDCKTWVKNGKCDEEPTKMDSWCPWSCHKCAPELLVTHKGCEDHSSSCKTWAKRGDCTNMPVFMFAFCRWSCKHCAKSSISNTVHDQMPRECREWVRNGDCYLHQEFMLQNCRESCMAGGYVNGKMSLDNAADCNKLAKNGYCTEPTSRKIMEKYCVYSCSSSSPMRRS